MAIRSVLRHICVVLLVVSGFAARADETPERVAPLVTTGTRDTAVGLIRADADWNWTFKLVDGREETFAARKVVRFGSFVPARGSHRVRLRSGGEILGYSIAINDHEIVIESDLLEHAVKLPRACVSAVVFDMPTDVASVQALETRMNAVAIDGDMLLFTNGDRLNGRIVSLTADKVTLKTTDAEVVVDRSRAAAVVLASPAAETQAKPKLKTWVGLGDGSSVLSNAITAVDKRATIALSEGITVTIKHDAVVALEPIGGDTAYLSDRHDSGYRHIPFLSLSWPYRRDSNVTGGPLVVDKRLYLKGLGMHSAARITYNLDGEYRAFQSELAIDDSTLGRGSVTCRVFTDDGSGKWQLKFESPVIRGGGKPQSVDVALGGAKRISLLVDFADRGDELDRVDWLEARLVK